MIFIECGIRHHDEDWQWDEEPDVTDAFCEVEIVGKKAYKGYFDLRDTMEWRKWKRLADAIRTATCIYRLEIKMSNNRITVKQESRSTGCKMVLYDAIRGNSDIEECTIE